VDDVRDRATLAFALTLKSLAVSIATASPVLAQDLGAAAGYAGLSQSGSSLTGSDALGAPGALSGDSLANGWEATIVPASPPRLAAPPTVVRVPKPTLASRPSIWPEIPTKPARSAGKHHAMSGIASYYWQGHTTASGEPFDKSAMTAAHPSLPFGTKVRVFCENTGRQVVVRINDRGPFKPGRIIDLSEGAADVIGMRGRGLTTVQLEVIRH
jgi:rare lipoprotein A